MSEGNAMITFKDLGLEKYASDKQYQSFRLIQPHSTKGGNHEP